MFNPRCAGLLAGVILLVLVAACAPAELSAPAPTDTAGKEKNTMSATPAPSVSGAEAAQVTQAKEDLARRLSIQATDIELVKFEQVTWPNGSLGCPQPGTFYTQMVEEGVLIQLRASGRVYEYHGRRVGAPFLCEK